MWLYTQNSSLFVTVLAIATVVVVLDVKRSYYMNVYSPIKFTATHQQNTSTEKRKKKKETTQKA